MGALPSSRVGVAARLTLALCALGGCGGAPEGQTALRDRLPPADAEVLPAKARLYGDARLLPDRAGERARRELALAGELRAHIGQLAPGAPPPLVTVELGPPARVLVTAPSATLARRDAVEALVMTAVPEAALLLVPAGSLDVADPGGPRRPAAFPWALALVWLAFGVSLGVTLERLRGGPRAWGTAHGPLARWRRRGTEHIAPRRRG